MVLQAPLGLPLPPLLPALIGELLTWPCCMARLSSQSRPAFEFA